ncbi:hypothetical protein GCM10010123_29120 [Pilimelia anulata]|uniref:Uncharacterized protein n=1 Tax=Pilimelia anulata TaxID=53371 RepID=A0A8J3B9B8_9ACTN|nr:hypothetical protein [Pilimelia anulata]GGJ97284.1 hypothetical protein GCM10010123_29120 [Pilimelia anulata]
MHPVRKRYIAASSALLVTVVGAAAWANWHEVAEALALTSSQDLQPAQIVGVTVTDQPIKPFKHNGLHIVVHNPNPYAVRISRITLDGPIAVQPGHPQCVKTGLTHGFPFFPNKAIEANKNGTILGTNLISMTSASDNGCQGASFHFPLRLRTTAD